MSVVAPAPPASAARPRTLGEHLTIACVFALFVLIYLVPLDYRPLFSPEETRYAEIPREMVASGDWVVPRLNGLRYFEKPPMGYWANAVTLRLFGERRFSVRLPGVLAAGITALVVFFMTRQVSASWRTGLLGAGIYLTFIEVYIVGTFSVLDSLLSLWITAGIFAFYRAVAAPDSAKAKIFSGLAGIAFGLAFLTKGFLGFVVPGLVLVPWLIWAGRVRCALARAWPCVAGALLICAPWSLAIHLSEADFWRYFFWEEHIRRFLADDAQHKQDMFYFIRFLPLLAFPWLFLTPASSAGLRSLHRLPEAPRDAVHLLWLWCLLPFAFFSLSSGKLTTYILPCFAPFATLTAAGLSTYLQSGRRKLLDYGLLFIAGFFLVLLALLIVAQHTQLLEPYYRAHEAGRAALLAGALALGAMLAIIAARLGPPGAKLTGGVLSMVALLGVTPFAMPSSVLEHKAPELLLSSFSEMLPGDAIVISNSGAVRAASWHFKRDDAYTISRHGELAYGLGYPDAAGRFLDPMAFQELLRNNAGRRDVVIVCRESCGDEYENALPAITRREESGSYRIWHVPTGEG